jgi:hypothetical protein
MRKNSLGTRFVRWAAVAAVGGSVFQLGGCDPAVRGALLDGLQTTTSSLSEALITAFFLTLEEDSSSSGGGGGTTTTGNNP